MIGLRFRPNNRRKDLLYSFELFNSNDDIPYIQGLINKVYKFIDFLEYPYESNKHIYTTNPMLFLENYENDIEKTL